MTINSLYENAKYPENIFVGLCQQNDEKDIDCNPKWNSQIRTIRVKHTEAKGPTWARYLCSTLFYNETYYLQIDSHCLFSRDWDSKLINMIKRLKTSGVNKPILSHYTREHTVKDTLGDVKEQVPGICKSFVNERGIISFLGAEEIKYEKDALPMPNAYAAGGMIFGESAFVKEVPYDPNLPYLFVGEEILHSARLWTHGWDIFTPTENVIYHYYTREHEPKIWSDISYSDEGALDRVKDLMNGREDIYGLGNKRTITAYYEYTGINKNYRDFCHDKDIRQVYNKYKL